MATKPTIAEVQKAAESKLADLLMRIHTDCKDKDGEELAGTMNFYWMEVVQVLRNVVAYAIKESRNATTD